MKEGNVLISLVNLAITLIVFITSHGVRLELNSARRDSCSLQGFKEFKSHLSAGFSSAAAHYSHSHLDLYAICVAGCPTGCHHYLCITT